MKEAADELEAELNQMNFININTVDHSEKEGYFAFNIRNAEELSSFTLYFEYGDLNIVNCILKYPKSDYTSIDAVVKELPVNGTLRRPDKYFESGDLYSFLYNSRRDISKKNKLVKTIKHLHKRL